MKTVSVFLMLVVPAFADGPPRDDSAGQLRHLFGKNSAFTALADVAIKEGGALHNQINGMKYAFLEGKLRADMDMSSGGAANSGVIGGMGMDHIITLVLPDKKASYIIYPGMKAYCEIPESVTSKQESKTERTELGKETVADHTCTKQTVVVTDEAGKTFEMIAWTAKDLQDFPIRSELQQAGQTVVTTFRDVKFTKPDATLFELPAGFKRYDNVQDMIMDSVQRIMGGQ